MHFGYETTGIAWKDLSRVNSVEIHRQWPEDVSSTLKQNVEPFNKVDTA